MGSYFSSCVEWIAVLRGSTTQRHPTTVVIHGATYRLKGLLGEGGRSFVYEGIDTVGGSTLAMKRYALTDDDQRRAFEEEVRIHRNVCPHPCVVHFVDAEVLPPSRWSVFPEGWMSLEFVPTSLEKVMNRRILEKRPLTPREVLGVMLDATCAVTHLHAQSPPLSHWDIKLENFLVEELRSGGMRCKLCDFGSTRSVFYICTNAHDVQIAEVELDAIMTTMYRSPETIDLWSGRRIDVQVDVWSLGVMLYALLFEHMPFEDNRHEVARGRPKRFAERITTPAAHNGGEGGDDKRIARRLETICEDHLLVADPTTRWTSFQLWEALATLAAEVSGVDVPRGAGGIVRGQRPQVPRFAPNAAQVAD